MNTETVIVPLDLTGCASEVIDVVEAIAPKLGARVILLNVVEIPGGVNPYATLMMDDEEWHTVTEVLDEDASSHLLPFRDRLRAAGLKVGHVLGHGDVTTAILDAVQKHAGDLVIMGTHGRRGLERMMLGSVAEQVIRRATCPVMVVRTQSASAHPGKSDVVLRVEDERNG
jgi:universal stress protein A